MRGSSVEATRDEPLGGDGRVADEEPSKVAGSGWALNADKRAHEWALKAKAIEQERAALRLRAEAAEARAAEVESAMRDWVVCFHCNERMPAPGAEDHGRICPKHPMRALERRVAELEAAEALGIREGACLAMKLLGVSPKLWDRWLKHVEAARGPVPSEPQREQGA